MASRAVVAPVCAALSSVIAGLTTYGDAILFHICSTLSRLTGLAAPSSSEDEELRFAVLCTTVMTVVTYFVACYLARGEVRRCLPYGLTMAVTGLSMVPVGSSLLFGGDLGPVKVGTGFFFASFATYYLTLSFREEAKGRLQGRSDGPPGGPDPLPQRRPAAATAAAAEEAAGKGAAAVEVGGQGSLILVAQAAAAEEAAGKGAAAVEVGGQDSLILVAQAAQNPGRCFVPWPEPQAEWEAAPAQDCRVHVAGGGWWWWWWRSALAPAPLQRAAEYVDSALHPLSAATPPSRALLILLLAGAGAGFLNGLLGTGGPPQMLAWAVIGAHKDLARATWVVYASLEVPLRIYFTVTGPNWNPSAEGAIYAAVGAASLVSYLLGSYLRRHCNTRAILRVMLLVVGLSSSILMGALSSGGVAGGCIAGAGVVGAWLLALRLAPGAMAGVCCLGGAQGAGGRGALAPEASAKDTAGA